ncbi:hypothetical protein M8C13_02430 [Crossiella sp. SN42]|uniref:hypothetical protein n=1 Tax=Crossiella sp. SN42 TaxID=2944808 RepID=UPI00207D140A|nr:hypothetical protein [Crossiella sp. SN42]MCO1574614.1 hypothetical protein [Crossiella sp. SN42]
MLAALRSSPRLTPVEDLAEAEVVLIDAATFEPGDLVAEFAASLPECGLPTFVLSVRNAAQAPPGSFPALVAAREAAVIEGAADWCVLRCAPLGQELAWNSRYETGGAMYTAWQSAGAPWVDAADVLDLVVRLAEEPARRQAAYEVTGPAVVSMKQACELLGDLHGRPLVYVGLDEEMLASAMTQVGFDPTSAAHRAGYMTWCTSAGNREVSPVLAGALGRPARPLADYLVQAARACLAHAE